MEEIDVSANCMCGCLWDHSYITSANGLGGWVQNMSVFAVVNYCIYADGWVRKGPKMCFRNIWMVPLTNVIN